MIHFQNYNAMDSSVKTAPGGANSESALAIIVALSGECAPKALEISLSL
jgi:hypothetical protein